jgi:hypothetical protein
MKRGDRDRVWRLARMSLRFVLAFVIELPRARYRGTLLSLSEQREGLEEVVSRQPAIGPTADGRASRKQTFNGPHEGARGVARPGHRNVNCACGRLHQCQPTGDQPERAGAIGDW